MLSPSAAMLVMLVALPVSAMVPTKGPVDQSTLLHSLHRLEPKG